MEINPQKFAAVVSGLASIGIVGATGYFLFIVFFGTAKPDPIIDVSQVNAGAFGPKIQESVAVLANGSKKLSFKQKDLDFTEKPLFKSFTDIPEVVPLSDGRGRPDPFVPYVAP